MKNNHKKINLYTQGQRLAVRGLFIVGLLVSGSPGSVLAGSHGVPGPVTMARCAVAGAWLLLSDSVSLYKSSEQIAVADGAGGQLRRLAEESALVPAIEAIDNLSLPMTFQFLEQVIGTLTSTPQYADNLLDVAKDIFKEFFEGNNFPNFMAVIEDTLLGKIQEPYFDFAEPQNSNGSSTHLCNHSFKKQCNNQQDQLHQDLVHAITLLFSFYPPPRTLIKVGIINGCFTNIEGIGELKVDFTDALDLSCNRLQNLPNSLGKLQLPILILSENELTSLPDIFDAKATELGKFIIYLDLSFNPELDSLPSSFLEVNLHSTDGLTLLLSRICDNLKDDDTYQALSNTENVRIIC